MKITVATYITLARIALVPLILYCLQHDMRAGATALFALAVFTDFLDGYIARRYNQQSALGAVLDPAADKLLMLGIFWLCAPRTLVIFLVCKELLLLAGGLLLFCAYNKVVHARLSGKVAFCAQVGYSLLLVTGYTQLHVLAACAVVLTALWALIDYLGESFKK